MTKPLPRFKHITPAELQNIHDKGWTSRPAGLYEPQNAPVGTVFVIVEPTNSFRRLTPPPTPPTCPHCGLDISRDLTKLWSWP